MKLALYLLFVPFLVVRPVDHAIYLSVVEVVQQESEDQVRIRVKVFSDDLQDVLRNYATEKDQELNRELSKSNELLVDYFADNLRIKVNNQPLDFTLQKVTTESDATFLILQATSQRDWKVVDIYAPYFTELFPAQINTFRIEGGGKKLFGKTSKAAPSYSLTLN